MHKYKKIIATSTKLAAAAACDASEKEDTGKKNENQKMFSYITNIKW